MPLKNFICPDAVEINCKDCLKEGGCRRKNRCATRAYLTLASTERTWTGKPSTTQLIAGTMYSFLKLTKDYSITPDSRAFMINGTNAHAKLENAGADDEYSLLEEKYANEDISGISDVIEEENGTVKLMDYKISGSFKVAKALGWTVAEQPTDEVYKSGKRKGEHKTIKILVQDKTKADIRDWTLQLNKYRIFFEKKFNKKISKLQIQVIVRDGNTFIARSRGVFRNVYLIDIPIVNDKEINGYFETKKKNLLQAIKQGFWNEICNEKENWEGLKCAKYCEVAQYCPFGKYLKEEKKSEEDMIKGLSDARRLPRLGKIRLGIMAKNAKGVEYPKEVDYFILDPETPIEEQRNKLIKQFEALFGKNPKSINIMLPVSDRNIVFPQFYKRYGLSSALKCKGDGETAVVGDKKFAEGLKVIGKDEMGRTEVVCEGQNCPYYKKKECSECATLNVFIPKIEGMGVWQITTGAINSIINLNSNLDLIQTVAGRIHMIPLTLERVPQETNHDGKKAIHYILKINTDIKLADVQKLGSIDPSKILLPESVIDDKDLLLESGSEVVNTETGEIKDLKQAEIELNNPKTVTANEGQILAIKKEINAKLKKLFNNDIESIKGFLKNVLGYNSTKEFPNDMAILQDICKKIDVTNTEEEIGVVPNEDILADDTPEFE
jgi:hypothetical protein